MGLFVSNLLFPQKRRLHLLQRSAITTHICNSNNFGNSCVQHKQCPHFVLRQSYIKHTLFLKYAFSLILVALFQCWWWVFCSSLLYLCCTFGASTRAHRFGYIHLSSEEEGKKPNISWTKSVVIFCSRVLFYRELNKNWLWEMFFFYF